MRGRRVVGRINAEPDCDLPPWFSRRQTNAFRSRSIGADRPHDREAAVQAVTGDSPSIAEYNLTPHSIEVYEGKVGIAHHSL